jgi:hypothetical protein
MANAIEHRWLWRLLVFAPTVIGLLYVTLKLPFSQGALILWCVINAICSLAASWMMIESDNLLGRVMMTFFIGAAFWLMNAAITGFGGCVCATGMVPL